MPPTVEVAVVPLLGAGVIVLLASSAVTWWLVTRRIRRSTRALEACLGDFRDGDFGRRIATGRNDGVGRLIALYNEVGDTLRTERRRLIEREMLLESILLQNPVAILLTRDDGRILIANRAAERLLNGGYRLTGKRLDEVEQTWRPPVRSAFASDDEAVFTIDGASTEEPLGEDESFHLATRRFSLNGREHTLRAVRRLTPELRRQEVAVWKRVIRTISHELNNTLAPISSLAHSAKRLHKQPNSAEQLDELLDIIGDSAARLRDFIASYARFARLPEPNQQNVHWASFLREVAEVMPFGHRTVSPDLHGRFDPAQLQQVLINLVKNASEAGSRVDDIEVRAERLSGGHTLVRVLDRGHGMTDEARARALVPFYSTKREGSGLGLALCREIMEAHGGRIDLAPREDGGTVVSLVLPGANGDP